MDRSSVITLVSESIVQDELLVEKTIENDKNVYAQVTSVTSSEFFDGGRNGLNPELRFIVFFGDYNQERIVKYQGKRYAVYRTYHARTDEIELYCERQGGVNNG